MDNLYARSVFFVKDAEQSLSFYTDVLGFRLDWNHKEQGKAYVFQVSLFGFELILNQVEPWTKDRAGRGRLFIGLNGEHVAPFREHLQKKGIKTTVLRWGAPTLVIHDADENELFFWLPDEERADLEARLAGAEHAVAANRDEQRTE